MCRPTVYDPTLAMKHKQFLVVLACFYVDGFEAGIKCLEGLTPAAAVKKANRLLCMIKRNLIDRSEATVLALYKSLIRTRLEYCIRVWNSNLAKDTELIEGVQRRATKLVHGIENCKYDDRLKCFGLTRLDKRRIRSD